MPWEAALLLRVGASVLFTIIILYLDGAKVPCSLSIIAAGGIIEFVFCFKNIFKKVNIFNFLMF
jgi:hypothetical protein